MKFTLTLFLLFAFLVCFTREAPTTSVGESDEDDTSASVPSNHEMNEDEKSTDDSVAVTDEKEVLRNTDGKGIKREAKDGLDTEDSTSTDEELSSDEVLVETNSGDVDGFKQTVLNRTVYTFLGIPYASPPIGEFRFKLPQILRPWRRPYKAHSWPPVCQQTLPPGIELPSNRLHEQMSEDCLYLNIWTPSLDTNNLKPVMVWFHGGFFSFGSTVNQETDGKVLSSVGDVVVVTFNYRLSAYGFINFEIPDAPGNMGLFDQNMALKWIRANIDRFGGDPNTITAFGQGAGAFSIGLHMSSVLSRNLFKRAILQSGSPVQLNFLFDQQSNTSESLTDSLGCNNEAKDLVSSEPLEALRCVKTQPTNSLKDAIEDVFKNYPLAFIPSIGDRMFPVSVTETFADPLYYYDQQKEVMIGVNQDEGSLFLHYALPDRFAAKTIPVLQSKEETKEILDKLMDSKWPLPDSLKNHISKFFLAFDPDNFTSTEQYTKHLYNVFSDNVITCPVVNFAKNFASMQDKTVYVYNFTQRSSRNKYADWVGVNTYEEVQFIFGLPIEFPDKYTTEEVEFSKRMLETWVQFAKTGKPSNQLDKEWPQYEPGSKEHMILNSKTAEVATGMDKNCRLFDFALNTDYLE